MPANSHEVIAKLLSEADPRVGPVVRSHHGVLCGADAKFTPQTTFASVTAAIRAGGKAAETGLAAIRDKRVEADRREKAGDRSGYLENRSGATRRAMQNVRMISVLTPLIVFRGKLVDAFPELFPD